MNKESRVLCSNRDHAGVKVFGSRSYPNARSGASLIIPVRDEEILSMAFEMLFLVSSESFSWLTPTPLRIDLA